MVHLGLDVGGTASRWVACDHVGEVVARGAGAGATGHLFNPGEKEKLARVLARIAADLRNAGLVAESVTTGMTGFGAPVACQLADMLGLYFGVGPEQCLTMDDMMLGYAAVFAPGEGHVVSAGTGSFGLHIAESGERVRVGGRGILIDDAGAGSWIALRALDALFRKLDHEGSFGSAAILAEEIGRVTGSADWNDVRAFVYGGDRGRIGTLSVAVGAAAERGDELARGVLAAAGQELARIATALERRVGPRPLGFVGGVFRLPGVKAAVISALAEEDVRFPETDAALAAARIGAGVLGEWRDVLRAG